MDKHFNDIDLVIHFNQNHLRTILISKKMNKKVISIENNSFTRQTIQKLCEENAITGTTI
jgi:hypothetical protein